MGRPPGQFASEEFGILFVAHTVSVELRNDPIQSAEVTDYARRFLRRAFAVSWLARPETGRCSEMLDMSFCSASEGARAAL